MDCKAGVRAMRVVTYRHNYGSLVGGGRGQSITAMILGFNYSTLSQRLLIKVFLRSCISVLFMILMELVSMWLGSLCKHSPMFY